MENSGLIDTIRVKFGDSATREMCDYILTQLFYRKRFAADHGTVLKKIVTPALEYLVVTSTA